VAALHRRRERDLPGRRLTRELLIRTRVITGWSTAPNRHLDPLWDAALRRGVLEGVYYAGETLPGWTQLGAGPVVDASRRRHVLSAPSDEELGRLVRRATWNLVVAFNPFNRRVVRACARARVPVFLLLESLQPRSLVSPRRIARDAIYARALRPVTGAFALSKRAAQDYARLGMPRERIAPGMYCGPEVTAPFRPKREARVVYCGRLVPEKAVDLLLQAIRRLAPRVPQIRLDVVGDGPERDALARLAQGLPVAFHGSVTTEVAFELIGRSAALVLPSRRWEGWGYVVNEALALGVPAVVSDVVAAREIVAPDGTGCVFREGDADGLATAIERALALHADPERASAAFSAVQPVLAPDAFLEYLISSAEGLLAGERPRLRAPWLVATGKLGGVDARWWEAWLGSAA
jgi:glycosyltransferase involved in cell wall biosynthesis